MSQGKLSTLLPPEDLATRLRRLMPFFLGGLGVALMIGGVAVNYFQTYLKTSEMGKSGNDPGFTPELTASVAGQKASRGILIEVSGAVEKPGVYEMTYNSRVKDVLIAAGGLVAKADRNYISKTINLAQRISDGQKIYFPFVGEQTTSGSLGATNSNIININTASEVQLDSLPGIGPATAGKIVAGRPYQNVSDLVTKKVITNAVFQRVKDKISVY